MGEKKSGERVSVTEERREKCTGMLVCERENNNFAMVREVYMLVWHRESTTVLILTFTRSDY